MATHKTNLSCGKCSPEGELFTGLGRYTGLRSEKSLSRIDLIQEIADQVRVPRGLILNLGSKETRFGDINVDVRGTPDVKASALFLPFKAGMFSVIIFSDVLEHLPKGTELRALRGIHRALASDGVFVLSTPSAQGLWGKIYRLVDPAFWLIGHRHYTRAHLRQLLSESGFNIKQFMMRGGHRDAVFNMITPVAYSLSKLTRTHSTTPDLGSDYSRENRRRGYTIIIKAVKVGLF